MPSPKPAPPRPKTAPSKSDGGKSAHKQPASQTNAERRGLEIFLRQRTGFHLALALYNDSLERASCIQKLNDALTAEKIELRVIDLLQSTGAHTLLDHVEAEVRSAKNDQRLAVMIINLESRVEYNPELHQPGSPGLEFLATANLHRELFEAACPFPLVIWMTELLERAIVKQAPDLWQWRSHVFDLRTRKRQVPTFTTPDGGPMHSDDDRLHPETRLQRLEDELAAYRNTGSRADEMRILNAIGLARLDAGDAKLARHDFAEVLRIAKELRNRWWEGTALGNLGNAHVGLGDARKAVKFYEQQLVITRENDDRRGEGHALGGLGTAHTELGNARKAIEFYEQSLMIAREIGDRRGEGAVLGNLGVVYGALGDTRKAIEFYEQFAAIAREIGDRRGESTTLVNLGTAYAALGDARKAIEFFEQARVIDRETGDRRGEGVALVNLGNAHAALGDTRKAFEFYEQSLMITREIGDRRGEGYVLWNAALVHNSLGHRVEAISCAEAALAIREAIEDPNAAKVRAALAEWRGE